MLADGGGTGRARTYTLLAIDALVYALVVAAGTLAVSIVAGVVTGGGLVRAKLVAFLAGWLLLGVATVRLWPRSPEEAVGGTDADSHARARLQETTRVESVAAGLPPLRWLEPPPRQLSPPTKLFVGAVLVLLGSLVLEVGFAVR